MPVNTTGKTGPMVLTGVTATGTTQATAYPLGEYRMTVEVANTPSSTGVRLPTARIGSDVVIRNAGVHALAIYPQPGGTIDGGSVNAPLSLAAGDTATFWSSSSTNWYSHGSSGGGGATYAVARFLIGPDSDIAVADDVAGWVPLIGSGTLHGAYVNSKTGSGPTGAALILDLKLSTDGGSTWTSLWATHPGNRPTIADGGVVGTAGAPDTTSYTNGNLVRLDVVQVGSTTPGRDAFVALF